MKVCGCKDCDLPVLASGMCNKHWRRNRLYGSPFVVTKVGGMLRGMPVEERFRRQVNKTDSCWLWKGARDRDGYGIFASIANGVKYQRAHRFSWAFHNGKKIPDGMMILHSCDTPGCVNPAHLSPGTGSQNQWEKAQRGRANVPYGELHPTAKLTEAQVIEILLSASHHSELAQLYNVTTMTISDIKCRRSWAHLDVPHIGKAKRVSPKKGKGSKITEDDVRAILTSMEPGIVLAERYGVSKGLICNIKKRRTWAHIEMP